MAWPAAVLPCFISRFLYRPHLGVERRVLVGDVGVERPSWAAAVLRVDVPRALGLAAGSEILAVRR